MSVRPPAILVGVDTEADDQWSRGGRDRLEVRNAERLPALQALCDEYGVRPTYVLTHEMATRPESRGILRELPPAEAAPLLRAVLEALGDHYRLAEDAERAAEVRSELEALRGAARSAPGGGGS